MDNVRRVGQDTRQIAPFVVCSWRTSGYSQSDGSASERWSSRRPTRGGLAKQAPGVSLQRGRRTVHLRVNIKSWNMRCFISCSLQEEPCCRSLGSPRSHCRAANFYPTDPRFSDYRSRHLRRLLNRDLTERGVESTANGHMLITAVTREALYTSWTPRRNMMKSLGTPVVCGGDCPITHVMAVPNVEDF
jgi:hypothetical protein